MGWGKSAHTACNSRIWKSQAGGGKPTVVCWSRKPLNRKGTLCETRSVPHGGAFSFLRQYPYLLQTQESRSIDEEEKQKSMKFRKAWLRIAATLVTAVLCVPGCSLADGGSVTLTETQQPALGGKGTWTVSYTLPDGCSEVTAMTFYLTMKESDNAGYTTVYLKQGISDSVETCEIVTAGKYRATVYLTFDSGRRIPASKNFTIEDDEEHLTLAEKAAAVAAECRVEGNEWQTVLNIHDWLAENMYYDAGLNYYGSDAMLRGYGVCDSYSRAFQMVCEKAGITASRVTGEVGNRRISHAWNAVRIDGKWYQVDVNLDDPGSALPGEGSAKSGRENHDYFCLNDDLMGLDHFNDGECFSEPCTSLAANWSLRNAPLTWSSWKDWNRLGNNVTSHGDEQYSERIREGLAGANGPFTVPCEDQVILIDSIVTNGGMTTYLHTHNQAGSALATRCWTLLGHVLSRVSFDGRTALVSYDRENNCFVVIPDSEGYTEAVRLPSYTTVIEANAFEGIGASAIIVPENCTEIKAGAFKNCLNLRKIILPKDCVISESAFEGCSPNLVICAPAGGTTQEWAEKHGIFFRDEDKP